MEAALKQLRIIWLTLLAFVIFYAVLSFKASVHATHEPIVFRAIGLVAAIEVVILFFFSLEICAAICRLTER